MKESAPHRVATRIRLELTDLERLLHQIAEGWRRAEQEEDDLCLDSVALNLYGFYSGLERIFSQIAEVIDGAVPLGENGNRRLLKRMAQENPPVRPAVISASAGERLAGYLGFQQAVYHAYVYRFEGSQMELLVKSAPGLIAQLKAELTAFAAFLER